MKKLIFFATLFLLCNNVILCQDAKKIASIAVPSTVALIMEDTYHQPISLGSGFIISNGKIVTNLHVIRGASYGTVLINGNEVKHKIMGYFVIDEKNDLAILSVPTLQGNPLSLFKNGLPDIGEKVYAIGNPKGLTGTISEGIVSGIRNFEGSNLIQITAPISPGSSGGPVINNSGQVVGVAVGTITDGQNLNFAIPATELINLIARCSSIFTLLNIPKESPKSNSSEKRSISEGIVIRNLHFETGIYGSDGTEPNHRVLTSFSIKNNLPYAVSDINILIIVYDKTGEPLDYSEETYCKAGFGSQNETLRPFLATTILPNLNYHARAYRLENNYEKIEFRVLDFKINEE